MEHLNNMLTPEIKNNIDSFSEKMKKEMEKDAPPPPPQETSDQTQQQNQQNQQNQQAPSYGENIGSLLNAFQNVLKEDPQIIDRTVNSIRDGGIFQGGGENGMAGMMGMLGNIMGGNQAPPPPPSGGPSFQLTDGTMDDYEEKQVILPCTQEEINNEVEKKFRLRLHPNEPDRKTTYKLKLEKDTYIYTFWYFSEEKGTKNTFVRVAVKLPDSETITSSALE